MAAEAGTRRSVRSSTTAVPHTPHDDEVVPSRGVAATVRPSVSTVTTLKAVSTADPVAQ